MKSKKSKRGIRHFHSSLDAHQRQGKQLIPPLLQLNNTKAASWLHDRLPEMVWAALLLQRCGRHKGLDVFRRFVKFVDIYEAMAQDSPLDWDPTLTALAQLPEGVTVALVSALDDTGVPRDALSPLLLLDSLPARERWQSLLPSIAEEARDAAWEDLSMAVAEVLDHQSQSSTDIRWMNLVFKIVLGKMRFHAGRDDAFIESLQRYPNHGGAVEPRIRAAELALRSGPLGGRDGPTAWCQQFWQECLDKTICLPLPPADPIDPEPDRAAVLVGVQRARQALLEHWVFTLTTSGVDARHDGTFALGFYALACLSELCLGPVSRLITGRLLVRTLTEIRITLAFLVQHADADIWMRFRTYGTGQAKLALLKYEDVVAQPPSLVSRETLAALANEDVLQEFVPIDLGHWSGQDLRKMAEQAGTKDDYDRFYGWTSGFVHGQWAAARDAVFATCANPLHRVHRVPLPGQRRTESCLPDALELVNAILASMDEGYPGLTFRMPVTAASDMPA